MLDIKNPSLIMLVGLPGTGKSTWLNNTELAENSVILSTDNYIQDKAEKENISYDMAFREHIKDAEKEMLIDLKNAVEEGKSIYWDQTNLTVKSRRKKLNAVPADIYFKIALVFELDESVLNFRLRNRAEESGKSIPYHIMSSMTKSFTVPTEEEGFDLITRI